MSNVILNGTRVTQRNAQRLVLSRRPEMLDESHKDHDGRRYWLIREGRTQMWFASGDTRAKAWVDAARRIADTDEKQTEVQS